MLTFYLWKLFLILFLPFSGAFFPLVLKAFKFLPPILFSGLKSGIILCTLSLSALVIDAHVAESSGQNSSVPFD